MDKLREVCKAVVGALGWGILGGMLLTRGIGPWWFGWGTLVLSLAAIASAVDKALEPANKWPV